MIWNRCHHRKLLFGCVVALSFCVSLLGLLFNGSSVNAAELVFSQNVDFVEDLQVDKFYCDQKNPTNETFECGGQTGRLYDKSTLYRGRVAELTQIRSNQQFSIQKDHYYVFHIGLMDTGNDTYANGGAIWQLLDNNDFTAISVKQMSDNAVGDLTRIDGGIYVDYFTGSSVYYEIILKAKATKVANLVVGASPKTFIYFSQNALGRVFVYPLVSVYKASNAGAAAISESIQEQTDQEQQHYEEQKQKEEQQEQDFEDSQSDTEDSANDAGEEANEIGTSLFSSLTALVGALHNTHVTDCKLPNFTIYSLRFTNMDLCSVDTPPGIMAIGSLIMVFLIVPLGIALVKQFLALYNEIFGS